MFNDARKIFGPDFGISAENLEKGELRFKVYGIYDTLTPAQLVFVDDNQEIMAKHLTPAQLEVASKIQAEDSYFQDASARIGNHVSTQIIEICQK